MAFTKVLVALTVCAILYSHNQVYGLEPVECACEDAVCSCVDSCTRQYGTPVQDTKCPANQVCCIQNAAPPQESDLEDIVALFNYYKGQEARAQEIADKFL